jgi:hypothetical protein
MGASGFCVPLLSIVTAEAHPAHKDVEAANATNHPLFMNQLRYMFEGLPTGRA